MNRVSVNGGKTFQIETGIGMIHVDGKDLSWSFRPLSNGLFSILVEGKSYLAACVLEDPINKVWIIRIKGQEYEVVLENPLDQLLKSMGLEGKTSQKNSNILAPMPGKVLKILVNSGQEIKQGEPILILEAMKMENNCRSTTEGKIGEIMVREGMVVEKGQVLVKMVP